MTTLSVPRLELFTDLGCAGGVRLSTGGFVDAWADATITKSEDGEESFPFSIPLTAEAAGIVREGHIARAWWSDTVYEEWLVRKVSKRIDQGGHVDVVCGPVSYRLAEHGYVPEWQVDDPKGDPLLDVGVAKETLDVILGTYLVDNTRTELASLQPWLHIAALPVSVASIEIDLSWSFASAQAMINAGVQQLQIAAGKPLIWRLLRNGSTSYDVTVLEVI